MGYVIFFLIAMVVIALAPYLFQIVLGIWLVSMILSLFMPNRRRGSRTFNQQQQQQRPRQQQQQRPQPKGDVIDVEFTQRDADED